MAYIISSGITSDGIILNYDSLDVLAGGSVNNTIVVDYGYMTVSSGGTANSTTVDSFGGMYIYSGGTAVSTIVNASGDLNIYKNGMATQIIENGGYVYVASGADAMFASNTINDLVLNWWSATVHSGTTANNAALSGGSLFVYNGGEANSTTIYNYGELHIFGGGTVNDTTVNSGFMYISSGGTADSTVVNPGGYICVSSGGAANQIVENGGYIDVKDGGMATLVSNIFSGVIGNINTATVHSCTVASDIVVCSSATVEIHGGTVSNARVGGEYSATISVFRGVADEIELLQKGRMDVSSGGTANNVNVNFNGYMTISSGATATGIMEKGGCVFVEDGAEVSFLPNSISDLSIGNNENATAHSGTIITGATIRGKNCGFSVYNGGVVSDISVTGVLDWNVYIAGLGVEPGGLVTGVSINSYGSCTIASGGTVSDIEINQKGKMNVSSGASVTGIVENGGYVNIEDGAIVSFSPNSIASLVLSGAEASATVHAGTVMTHATIVSGGGMYVLDGGKADDIAVMAGGGLTIASGGTATDIAWTPTEGSVSVESGAYVTFASKFSGIYYGDGRLIYHSETVDGMSAERGRTMYVMSGGVANNVPSVDGTLIIWSGGVVNGAEINAAGYWNEHGAIAVSSGGTANDVVVNDGYLIVSLGGIANNAVLHGGKGSAFVYGGLVNGVTIDGNAPLGVFQDGEVNYAYVQRGTMNVFYGGVANSGIVGANTGYGASLNIFSSGTANDIAVEDGGLIHVSEGGTINRATVNQGGNMNVSSGGVATDAMIHAEGRVNVLSNGTLRGGTVNEQGYLIVSSGGKLTGRMTLESGAVVSAETGATVDFDLTRTAVDADVLFNDLSRIQGTPFYTLTVDGQQKTGEYYLAKGASSFNQAITIRGVAEDEAPVTISVGQTVNYGGMDYTLNLPDGDSLELFFVKAFCIYRNSLIHGYVNKDNNGSIKLTFSEEIDESAFSPDYVSLNDKNGTSISITGFEISGRKLTLYHEPLSVEGTYVLKVSEKVKSVLGHTLDQNENSIANEAEDAYTLQITADFTAPKVVNVSPDEDFAGMLTALQITFSSEVDFKSVSGQISLIGPDGQEIAPSSYKQITASTIEVTVPEQTAYGQYKIKVGSQICDMAGNRLDQNGDGNFGGEDDIYFGTFNITKIDLKVSDVSLEKTIFQPGEKVNVCWTDYNDGGYELSGSWTDGVYLSTDTRWDVNDILLGSLSHDGGLTQDQQRSNGLTVSLAGVPTGTYYLLVRSDIYMQEKGDRESALAAQNLEAVEITVEIPELTIGTPVTVQNVGSGDCSYFHFKQEADTAIKLNLFAGSGSNWELYVAEGFVPTREQYGQTLRNIGSGTINLSSGDSAGDIYVMVCAKNVPDGSTFTLNAVISDMEIIEVSSPRQSIQTDSFFEVSGMNFSSEAVITLRASDGTVYTPDATYYINSEKIRFEFTANTLAEDIYDLCINAGERTAIKDNCISMVVGTGAELSGQLITPASVGYHVASTLTFNYSNSGFSSMDAPLIILKPVLYYETQVRKKYYIDAHGRKREVTPVALEDYPVIIALSGETFEEWRERNSYIVEDGSSISVEESPYGESTVGEESSGQVTRNFTISMPASTAASDDAISQGRSKAVAEALTTGKQSLLGETAQSSKNGTKLYPGTIFWETSKVITQKEGAILTLDKSIADTGFWTSNMPEGFSTSVSFLASGENGILLPGESGTVDIYYNGWQQPWDYSYPPVRWNLSYITTANTTTLDWNAVMTDASLSNDLKNILASNLKVSVGDTWGDYVKMLNSNMKYLADIGAESSTDSDTLFHFEVMQQCGALSPFRVLQTSTDLRTVTPGLSWEITREYHSDLLSRYQQSSFGFGWTCSWDIALEVKTNGDLTLLSGGTRHSYQLSAKSSSAKTVYTTVDGDDGSVMRKTKNGYTLTKRDGTVYSFDASGQLDSVSDSCGNTITCIYTDGKLTRLKHSSGQSLTITRNQDGTISEIEDRTGHKVSYSYLNGNLVSVTDALAGTTIAYAYDATHGMTSALDAAGQETVYLYDEDTKRLSGLSARGGAQTVSITYGEDGDVYITESNGASYAYAYDAKGRIAKADNNTTGVETFIRYDENGNPVSIRDSRKNAVSASFNQYKEITGFTDILENAEKVFYDADGHIIRSIDAHGNVTEYDYNEKGCLSAVYYADGTSNLFKYDLFGNLTAFTDVKGNTATFQYNADGLCSGEQFNGNCYAYEYDPQGNLSKCVLLDDSALSFAWDGRGNLVRFTDARGNNTVYDYDANSNLTAVTREDGTGDSFSYNQYNDLVGWTSARGTSSAYTYGETGLLTAVEFSDGTSYTIAYDDLDRVVGAGDLTFVYGQNNLVTTVKASDGREIAYEYDRYDRVISVSDGMHTTVYSYTAYGDLDLVTTETGALVADYDYDRFGNLAKITRGNGTSVVYSYNEWQELDGITEYDKSENAVNSIRYRYDAESRIVSKSDSSGTWSYSYDKAGRLIRAVQTSNDGSTVLHSEEYAYDSAGNRLSSVIDGETKLYSYDNRNRIVSCNDFAYRYDADGNLLEDEERVYTWTAGNRVLSETLKSSGQTWTHGYDALGNRVQVETDGVVTTYTVDANGNVLAEYVNGIFVRSYIQGNQLAAFVDANGNTYYYSSDLLGSTIGITDDQGVTVNSYLYDSFGNVLGSTEGVANDFEFVGGYGLMSNASGTTFVRARNYDPVSGRWISEDPIGISGGVNLYVYCGNDGVNGVDITGFANKGRIWELTHRVDNFHANREKYATGDDDEARNKALEMERLRGQYSANLGNIYDQSGLLNILSGMGNDAYSGVKGLIEFFNAMKNGIPDRVPSPKPQSGGRSFPESYSGISSSIDPNDKLGPEGIGEKRYVSARECFEYTVRFENDPEMANSPVKWVRVYDTLDAGFDLDTFELKEFNLAGINFTVGDGRDAWHDKVTVEVNGESVLVDASVGLEWSDELEVWQLVAEFTAIDPENGAMIQDPASGFLYPNDDTGRGDGHISYSVSLKDGVSNNTQVRNTAEIYFDFNDPIDTPTVVNTVDSAAPVRPGIGLSEKNGVVTMTVSAEDAESGIAGYYIKYSLDGENYYEYCVSTTDTLTFNGTPGASYYFIVQAIDNVGNISEWSSASSVTIPAESSVTLGRKLTWDAVAGATGYIVEYSTDDFEHLVRVCTETNEISSFRLPAGSYQWRVKPEGGEEWTVGEPVVSDETDMEPQLVKSDADGNADVFFANSIGTWEASYLAQHVGSTADTWGGTKEYASLYGKNKLADIIEGSTDANVLLMTDDENGDALFVDDIYSALPGSVTEQQSRIARINEIRAGEGNDIVDMTSQRFEYVGDGLAIRGGAGNDTLWANKGGNRLFGDAGDDRIVGASGNDIIAGGIGSDRMHGGGGDDVFTFCDNWGSDNVEQLATGSVTLWFLSGSEANWNKSTLTYMDGDNSVKVSGVAADKITLKFGNDGFDQFATLSSIGAFMDATTERIFEESGKGMLASL